MDMQNMAVPDPLVDSRKEKRNAILITIAVVLVAAVVIGLVVYSNLSDRGYFLRREVAAQSENYTVNGSMMTYFFYSNYSQYASYFSQMGLDTQYTLKSQYADEDNGITWFDYMATLTQSYVGEVLALCEAANEAGLTLTEEDMTNIDATITAMEESAEELGYTMETYLMAMFGSGVKEDDIRDALELVTLSGNYYNQFNDALTYTDKQYEDYYEANKSSYQTVDFITCTIKQDDFIEKDENGNPLGNITEAAGKAKEYAESIAASTNVEDFKNAVLAYYTDVKGASAEDAQASLDALTLTGVTANVGNTASDWAFSAKAGDTTIVDASGGATYDVYYLVSAAARDDSPTRNVRHLLLTEDTYGDNAENAIQTIYDQWESTGFDLDTFTALVYNFTEDTGSRTTGGLYENVSQGDMVTEFDEWLFDPARKEGDTGIVKSDYGYHIMYYGGEDVPAWKADADDALRTEDYTALIEAHSSGITFDSSVIYSINA